MDAPSLALAGTSVIIAAAAALWARSSATSAGDSAREAKRVADIEAARRHDEREPDIRISYEPEDERHGYLSFVNAGRENVASAVVTAVPAADGVCPLGFYTEGDDAPLSASTELPPLRLGAEASYRVYRTYKMKEHVWLSVTCTNQAGDKWTVAVPVQLPNQTLRQTRLW